MMTEHNPLTKEDVWNKTHEFYDGSVHLFRVRSAVMFVLNRMRNRLEQASSLRAVSPEAAMMKNAEINTLHECTLDVEAGFIVFFDDEEGKNV